MDEIKTKFPIGEMSKLHNVPIKTLRYYDEIGLFVPAYVNSENGYRYYSAEQFELLNNIKYLKFLGFSLKEIKKHMYNANAAEFLMLMKKQKELTQKKIEELEIVKTRFEKRIEEIEETLDIKSHGEMQIINIPERKIIRQKKKIKTNDEMELYLRELVIKNRISTSIFIGKVGLTVSLKNLKKGIFNEYSSIFLIGEDKKDEESFDDFIPAGKFLQTTFIGNHTQSEPYYLKLLGFISENNLKICGYAFERTILDHTVSKNPSHYITQIQIPISSLDSPVTG